MYKYLLLSIAKWSELSSTIAEKKGFAIEIRSPDAVCHSRTYSEKMNRSQGKIDYDR